MNCEECSGLLIDYLEDTLGSNEAGAVKEHLDGCRECSLELEHYREIQTAARREDLPEVSSEVLSKLGEAARKNVSPKKTPFWKKWSYSPILVPTISAAIALSVWFYYGQTGFEGVDTVTREVGAMKMSSPEMKEEALGDSGDEQMTLAFEDQEPTKALKDTLGQEEQEKPAGESRIKPAPPAEPETDTEVPENVPAKGVLRKKDVTEEDLIQYRKGKSSSSGLLEKESRQTLPDTSSDEAASERPVAAARPVLKDYAGELDLARHQQAEGNCGASIKTNEAILNSTPPPPLDVQAGSYQSLAECYVETGELGKAVSSYKSLSRVDPAQSELVNKKLEEIKIDAASLDYEESSPGTEPAN